MSLMPAPVPVVRAADQHAQVFVGAEALADGPVELADAAAADDRRVPAEHGYHGHRLVRGRLRADVDAAADPVAVHVRLQRLVDFDRLHEVRRDRVHLDLPNAAFRRRHVDAIDRQVAEAWLGAANLDVLAFAFVALECDAWQPPDRIGDVRVRQARDDLRRQHLDDVVRGALAVDLTGFATRPPGRHEDRLALAGYVQFRIDVNRLARLHMDLRCVRLEAEKRDRLRVVARRHPRHCIRAVGVGHGVECRRGRCSRLAPGSTAPEESVTRPSISPLVPWLCAAPENVRHSASTNRTTCNRGVLGMKPRVGERGRHGQSGSAV